MIRQQRIDTWLLFSVLVILGLGLVMVASASAPVAERLGHGILHFAWHQAVYITVGLSCAFVVTCTPMSLLEKRGNWLLAVSALLLILVLIPGITRPINGSMRWLFLGPISIQPSELAKIALILYVSGYMVRRRHQLQTSTQGFFIPMFVLALAAILLMLEPDFGSVVVLATTFLGMLFLGGARLRGFAILIPFVLGAFSVLIASSSYRMKRLIAFRDPWADQFDTGYQLVQSLIAFGRGSWFGSGLGGSMQKMLYLPESHSDFILAVLAEELGLIGVIFVLSLYAILTFRAMEIGRKAKALGKDFSGNLAYGIALLISTQTLINVSVNVGLLPTKGLTLPLMSAGGSSMIMACIAIGMLFRIDYENRC